MSILCTYNTSTLHHYLSRQLHSIIQLLCGKLFGIICDMVRRHTIRIPKWVVKRRVYTKSRWITGFVFCGRELWNISINHSSSLLIIPVPTVYGTVSLFSTNLTLSLKNSWNHDYCLVIRSTYGIFLNFETASSE